MNIRFNAPNQNTLDLENTLINQGLPHFCCTAVKQFQRQQRAMFNYPNFAQRTQRATLPIHVTSDLDAYLALYAMPHIQRLKFVLEQQLHLIAQQSQQSNTLSIFDYGCGQGLATLTLLHVLNEHKINFEAMRIVLIEPSRKALLRAKKWVQAYAQALQINVFIEVVAASFDQTPRFLNTSNGTQCHIHLLSNILDMHHTQAICGRHLAKIVAQLAGHHLVFACSPAFYSANIGYRYFDASLPKNRQQHLYDQFIIPVKEYNAKFNRVLMVEKSLLAYCAEFTKEV